MRGAIVPVAPGLGMLVVALAAGQSGAADMV